MPEIIRYPSPSQQIAQHYRDAITAGTLKPDDELPPIRRLGSEWGVALNTALAAIGLLAADGWVAVRLGQTAIVIGVPPDKKDPK